MKSYALVLTHNRQDMVTELTQDLQADGVETFVIDHASDPTPSFSFAGTGLYYRRIDAFQGEQFNISALWNIGLDWIGRHHQHSGNHDLPYAITVLNDDVLVPSGFCQVMAAAIDAHDVDIASPGGYYAIVRGPAHQIQLHNRPAGYAWTVRGGALRVDETMRVWYSDDDLWQQALEGRGYVLIPGHPVDHRDANGNFSRNGWWQEQAGRDRETFVKKWGRQPW